MSNRLRFLPQAINKNSIISEGRKHIANQQNSSEMGVSINKNKGQDIDEDIDENTNNVIHISSHDSKSALELPELKRVVLGTHTRLPSTSDAASKLLYELKYISLSIRSVSYRKIEIANDSLYYNIHSGVCSYTSPPGFFLIPPSTILPTLQLLQLHHKIDPDWPKRLVRMPSDLLNIFKTSETNIVSSVINSKYLDKIDGICGIVVEQFLQSNSANLDISSTSEYAFLQTNLKFKAAQRIFKRKLLKIAPAAHELNINVIEILLLQPECSYLSRNNYLSYFQSKYRATGHLYAYSDLSLSWRILTHMFALILLKEEYRINDRINPNDCRVIELFANHNIKKYINAELYNYNGTTTAPCFYRSLWSLVSTHTSINASIQSEAPVINISNPRAIYTNTQFAFPNTLQLIVQQILASWHWGNAWKVTMQETSSDSKVDGKAASDCEAVYITSLNDFRQHSLQHIDQQCLMDDWVMSSWKNQEMNNYLITLDAFISELMKLSRTQLVGVINAVAIRGTKRALRNFPSYPLWANNSNIDSDFLFAQYFLLFRRHLIIDMVSLELNELRWKKKLHLNINKNDMLELHKACPVAWLCLPSDEFQAQLHNTLLDINTNISMITFNSSGVFDKLIQNEEIPDHQKLEKIQLILPNVAPGVLDRCLHYACIRIKDSIS